MQLSVAMCTYNGADYLEEQLASIAAQSRLPDELIVCDDGSQDDSVVIVERFAEQAPFEVRLYQNGYNMGSSKNFEQAIRFCRGDVIVLSDQDDRWKVNKLETILEVFLRRPDVFYVFSDADLIDHQSKPIKKMLWDGLDFRAYVKDYNEGNQLLLLLKKMVVTGATLAFRTSLRNIILPISDQWVHDGWIALLASATHHRGLAFSEPLIDYRLHPCQQIGLRKRSLFNILIRNQSEFVSDFDRIIGSFQDVQERLELIADNDTDFAASLELLACKIEHCTQRREMLYARWGEKLRIIKNEYRRSHYRMFSKSLKTVLKDIWMIFLHG